MAASIAVFAFISVQATAQPASSYQAGAADRAAFELWFGNLSGDYQTGASYWATHRSNPKEAHCVGYGEQLQGCLAAQQRLAPFDVRRRSEPSYRLGWNGAPQPVMAVAGGSPAPAAEPLYHVQHNTYGCHNPRAALALTNPEDARRFDPGWVDYVINDGHCAPVTPNSPWKMERREGDLAVMTYAGTTGLPGTYYLRASDLTTPVVSPPAVAPPSTFGTSNSPFSSQPALPYNSIPALPLPSATTANTDPLSGRNAYRPDTSNGGDTNLPSLVAKPSAPVDREPVESSNSPSQSQSDGSNWSGLLIAAAVVAFVAIIMISKTRAKEARRRKATSIAFSEISEKAHLLHVRREQLTQPDFYGTRDFGKWEKEKVTFIETRIMPLLNGTGMADLAVDLMPIILTEIEAAAGRPIAAATRETFSNPEVYSPDMDPIHYEMHCALQLQKAGWVTKATPRTGDQGADILAERNGITLVVQCKLYSNNVGNGAVQEAVAARVFHRTTLAVVASNAAFTRSARDLAGMSDVTLLHHSQLPAYTGKTQVTDAAD